MISHAVLIFVEFKMFPNGAGGVSILMSILIQSQFFFN